MSENLVQVVGDTTTRELYEGGPTVSTGVSRKLSPENRNYSMLIYQQAKPPLDSEHNLAQQNQNYLRAQMLRKLLTPGVLSLAPTYGVTSPANCLRISDATVHAHGWLLNLYGANRSDQASDIIFPAAPNSGSREDLAFAEIWFEEVAPTGSQEDDDENVYKYGGMQSGTLGNDLLDSVAGAETTRRVQLRWNIRTVSDVDFVGYPAGVTNGNRVKARGGANSDSAYTFAALSGETGLYRAGDGSTSACSALKCVDGYVYAIPLFQVHRRNATAYNPDDNTSGAGAYPAGSGRPDGLYSNVIDASDVKALYTRALPYDGEAETKKSVVKYLIQQVNAANTELDKWQNQRVQQGEATLYNKYVRSGCVVNAVSGTRNIKVTKTGTYLASNYSLVYVDGHIYSIADTENSVAAVPTNTGTTAVNYYAYVDGNASNGYTVRIADAVPVGKLGLYRITVPAGDTAANLNAVSFADIRRVEGSENYYNTRPTVSVPMPGYAAVDAPDYDVHLSVLSHDGVNPGIEVIERQSGFFTVALTGEADNVKFRWTLVNQVH